MFVRKKRNRSGTISVVVIDKRNGKFVELKNFGTAKAEEDADKLVLQAKHWLATYGGQQLLDFDDKRGREREETERVIGNIDALLINGTQLLLGRLYDEIGFNAVRDDVLRHLVMARLSQPRSKLATVEYLKSYYDEDVNLDRIYNYMDRLYNRQRELVQRISVEHTRRLLGGRLGLLFYDVTTLYFESAREDELRSPGFSKDGKTAETQVVLGLLVSDGGYLLSYAWRQPHSQRSLYSRQSRPRPPTMVQPNHRENVHDEQPRFSGGEARHIEKNKMRIGAVKHLFNQPPNNHISA